MAFDHSFLWSVSSNQGGTMKSSLMFFFICIYSGVSLSASLQDVPENKVWSKMEQISNIDAETWYSIALAESGKTIDGQFIPHAFAIAVGKDLSIGQAQHIGFYPTSKEEAIDILAELLADGHTNIGIGMMQINIKQNPDVVSDVTSLFDPETNLKAAYTVLKWCSKHESIRAILSCYNRGSSTSVEGLEYADRVLHYQQKYASKVFEKPPIGELSYAQLLALMKNRASSPQTRRSTPIQIIN